MNTCIDIHHSNVCTRLALFACAGVTAGSVCRGKSPRIFAAIHSLCSCKHPVCGGLVVHTHDDKLAPSQGAEGNTSEFTAYSILYSVCTNRCANGRSLCTSCPNTLFVCPVCFASLLSHRASMTLSSQTEIKKLLRELDPAVANGESVQHALRVRDTCPTDVHSRCCSRSLI